MFFTSIKTNLATIQQDKIKSSQKIFQRICHLWCLLFWEDSLNRRGKVIKAASFRYILQGKNSWKQRCFSNMSSELAINIFIEINKLKPRHKKNLIFSHLKINLFAQSYLLHTEELVKNIFEIFNLLSLIQNSRRETIFQNIVMYLVIDLLTTSVLISACISQLQKKDKDFLLIAFRYGIWKGNFHGLFMWNIFSMIWVRKFH